jgi:hypothetical protein
MCTNPEKMEFNIYATIGIGITAISGLVNLYLKIQANTILIKENKKDIENLQTEIKEIADLKIMIEGLSIMVKTEMSYLKDNLSNINRKFDKYDTEITDFWKQNGKI